MKTTGIILFFLIQIFITFLIANYATKKWESNKIRTRLFIIGLPMIATIMLALRFGFSVITIKGSIYASILTFASFSDIKSKECDYYIHLLILLVALMQCEIASIPYVVLSSAIIGVVLITLTLISGGLGGADILLSMASFALLGVIKGTIGLCVGMVFAIIFNLPKKKRKEGFALIPYLSIGYFAAYLI